MAGELTRVCRLIPSAEEEGGRNKGRVDTGCKWLGQDGLISRQYVPPPWGPTHQIYNLGFDSDDAFRGPCISRGL